MKTPLYDAGVKDLFFRAENDDKSLEKTNKKGQMSS